MSKSAKYVLVSGGIISGLGKGSFISSLGYLFKKFGHVVSFVKIDPYLNMDANNLSPYQHGECYVLKCGSTLDLDFGYYERFTGVELDETNSITTGKVYHDVITKERSGAYLGKTVQIIPHITNNIIERIQRIDANIVFIELGGAVENNIEALPFIEALRQLKHSVGPSNFCHIHLSLIINPPKSKEQKTKPTQASIRSLLELGHVVDFLACRTREKLFSKTVDRLSQMTSIEPGNIISLVNVDTIYKIPEMLHSQRLAQKVMVQLGLKDRSSRARVLNLDEVRRISGAGDDEKGPRPVRIMLVGKYIELVDSYTSIVHTIDIISARMKRSCRLVYVDPSIASDKTKIFEAFRGIDGMICPAGFGKRDIEGKITFLQYARENDIPTLGICLGFQLMAIEFLRNMCGLQTANSDEFSKSTIYPCIVRNLDNKMITGSRKIKIVLNSLAHEIYQKSAIEERFRHRYHLNVAYVKVLAKGGMYSTGFTEHNLHSSILEYKKNRFHVGTQYHSEFSTTLFSQCPLFTKFLAVCSSAH